MGSDLLCKMGLLGLVMVTILVVVGYTEGASIPGECCKEKMVGGVSYVLVEETDTGRYGCHSNCVFEKVDSPGSRFCFKEGDLEVVCEDDDNGGVDPCPVNPPTPGSACQGSLLCPFGEECCCGECHASSVYSCMPDNQGWQLFLTDACSLPPCGVSSNTSTAAVSASKVRLCASTVTAHCHYDRHPPIPGQGD